MSHAANTRAFSRRMGRGFWSRAKRFSESAKPATGRLASDGTTGADSGLDSQAPTHGEGIEQQHQQRGSHEVANDQTDLSPPSTHSAGGGVCSVMPLLAAQVHADRWLTLAVIAVFICAFAVAAIRANRSSRPQSPPRGQSAARPRLSGDE